MSISRKRLSLDFHQLLRLLPISCWLIVTIVLSAPMVWAQAGSTTGALLGTVKDGQGAILAGATITVQQLETNLERTTQVGEDGVFQILQLPPGKYQVSVLAEGFVTETLKLNIDIGRTEVAKFTLMVAGSTEVVEVKAVSGVDITRTESSTNVPQDSIDGLPINQRDFLNFTLTSPRVSTDRVPMQGSAQTSGLSFNGQTARANNITIDGLDNNDSFSSSVRSTFSQDAVQEFQIVSDSFSAEFGRALGGIVNIVTRRGSNGLHGKLFFANRNDTISAREVFTLEKPPYQQYQFGAAMSGPIKKDRAFFFTSFERRSIRQNNIVTISDLTVAAARRQGFNVRNGAIPFSIGTTTALARADLQLSDSDQLWIRYNYGGTYNGALEPFGGLVAESNGGIQRLSDNTLSLSNTYLNANLNLINETRFQYSRRDQDLVPIDPSTNVRIVAPEGSVILGRGPFLPQFRRERIYQFVNNTTLVRGKHQVKFGLDYLYVSFPDDLANVPILPSGVSVFNPVDFSLLSGIPGLPILSGLQAFDPTLRTPEQRAFLIMLSNLLPNISPGFPSNLPIEDMPIPVGFIQGFGNRGLSFSQHLFSAFVQDEIKLKPNLLIKAGLRYDINRVDFTPKNNGNLSPRIGISYQPTRVPGLSLHGSYGIFFAGAQAIASALTVQNTSGTNAIKILQVPIPFSILAFAQPGHQFPEGAQLPSSIRFIPQLNQSLQYQKDLRNSYTQQINGGFDYQIGNNTVVSANYTFVRGVKLLAVRNINPVVNPTTINPVDNAITGRVDTTRGDVFEYESAFDSYYHAGTFSLTRRLNTRFKFFATYTWAKAIDNYIDIRIDLQEVNDATRPDNERGLSVQDLRSRFVLSGIFDIGAQKNKYLKDFQLSTITTLESGRPFNIITGVDLNLNGDNGNGDRPNGLGRNVGITPGFASIDVRLTRNIQFGERVRLVGFVEVFNLFNRTNINTVDRLFPPDAQGNFVLPRKEGNRIVVSPDRYRSAFAPRQFQVGFNLNF